MKKAHNVYTEEPAWKAAREASVKYRDLLGPELTRHTEGSSSAYYGLAVKACLLADNPGLIHDKRVDWKAAIEYAQRIRLPLSKYISECV